MTERTDYGILLEEEDSYYSGERYWVWSVHKPGKKLTKWSLFLYRNPVASGYGETTEAEARDKAQNAVKNIIANKGKGRRARITYVYDPTIE